MPALLLNLFLGIKFCQVINREYTDTDYETRRSFFRAFFVCQIVLNAILSIGAIVIVNKNELNDICAKEDFTDQDCQGFKAAVTSRFVFNLIVEIAINLYYCYVCKLYADLVKPASAASEHYQN